MFTSTDLIQLVRDSLQEFDSSPIDDSKIMAKLNLAYSFAYNALSKSNNSLFQRWGYLTITPTVSFYDLPKNMYSRRIDRMWTPVPAYDPIRPFAWEEIIRCDPMEMPSYQTPQFSTYYALNWTQLADKIIITPPPNTATVLRYSYTPALIPMAKVEGQITEINGSIISIDKTPSAELIANLSLSGYNCIGFSDEISGEVKALYPYNELDGYDITLSSNFNRPTLRGKEVRKCYSLNPATNITYDPIAKTCTCLFNSSVTGKISVGDVIEISRISSADYNIVDTLESDTDFYQPAEYSLQTSTFSRSAKVLSTTATSIVWEDTQVVPDFTDGYPTGFDDGTFTGTFTVMAVGTLYSQPVVLVTCTVPHNLTVGRVFKLNIAGTNTNMDGTKKCIPTGADQIAILAASFTGTFSGSATWAMYQYSSLVVTTGWPSIYDISPGHPRVEMLGIFAGSPYTYEARDPALADVPSYEDIIGNGMPGTYDHKNDIKVGDFVTLGYTTAIPYSVELISEFLVFYCTLTLKSGLNETDPEILAILKEKLVEIRGDTDGRNLMLKVRPNIPRGVANYGRGRR